MLKVPRWMTVPHKRLSCSFCRRSAAEVERLVAGAAGHICDTCIAECVAILQDNGGFEPRCGRAPPHAS